LAYKEAYLHQLWQKDMYYLMIKFYNAHSKDPIGTAVDILFGGGKPLDEGIGDYCATEYNKWAGDIINNHHSKVSSPFDIFNSRLFSKSVESNIDSYYNYVLVRDKYEFLFRNPNSPLVVKDASIYLSGVQYLIGNCPNWENCVQRPNQMLSVLGSEGITQLVGAIKYDYPNIQNRYSSVRARPYLSPLDHAANPINPSDLNKGIQSLIEQFVSNRTPKSSSFNLMDINNNIVPLFDFTKNKGVILAFTTSTCNHDYHAIQKWNYLNEKFEKLGYPVLAVNSGGDPGNSLEEMTRKAAGKNYTFNYVKDIDSQVAKTFDIEATPYVCIISFTADNQYFIHYKGALFQRLDDGIERIEEAMESLINKTKSGHKVTRDKDGLACKLE
jgi:peroxiredoxin